MWILFLIEEWNRDAVWQSARSCSVLPEFIWSTAAANTQTKYSCFTLHRSYIARASIAAASHCVPLWNMSISIRDRIVRYWMNSVEIIVIILVTASKPDPLRGVDYYLRWEPIRRWFARLPRAWIKIGNPPFEEQMWAEFFHSEPGFSRLTKESAFSAIWEVVRFELTSIRHIFINSWDKSKYRLKPTEEYDMSVAKWPHLQGMSCWHNSWTLRNYDYLHFAQD